jgi:hypothetical protein
MKKIQETIVGTRAVTQARQEAQETATELGQNEISRKLHLLKTLRRGSMQI